MEKVRTILIIIVSILIGVFGYIIYQSMGGNPPVSITENKVIEPTITAVPTVLPSQTESTQSALKTYSSIPLGFSIDYPPELEPIKQGETIVFSKWGPSQKKDTEFYDGLNITFSAGSYSGSFETFVNQQLEEVKNWPTYVSSTNIKALVLAGKEAYSFEAVTMGKASYYFIKKSPTEYFKIIDATNDPTNQGFANTIKQMLGSLEVE